MKNAILIILLTLLGCIIQGASFANGIYPGFTSTIIPDYNPNNSTIIAFTYFSNQHTLYSTSPDGGALTDGMSEDSFYPNPPNAKLYLIYLSIYPGYTEGQPFCKLKYNALTRTHQWIINRTFQPNKAYPPIRCEFYLYPHHMFVAVTDKK